MIDSSVQHLNLARLTRLADFRYHLRCFLHFSERVAEQSGVATQQYQLMQVIGALPEGEPATISHVAERMVLRHNSTVELVDRATRAGLVRRRDDERDLRRSLVELTPEGQAVLYRLIAAHLAELEGAGGEQLFRALGQLREEGEGSNAPAAEDRA